MWIFAVKRTAWLTSCKSSRSLSGYVVGVELNVVDGYLDDTAQSNSCTKPVCISTYSMWIVLDLFLLHPSWACTVYQNTLHRFWVKKIKGMEDSVLHWICTHSLFGKLTQICQFHVKSGQSYQQSWWKFSLVFWDMFVVTSATGTM